MPEGDPEPKPYRYSRQFTVAPAARPPAEMDKDALDSYIKSVLGIGDKEEEKSA